MMTDSVKLILVGSLVVSIAVILLESNQPSNNTSLPTSGGKIITGSFDYSKFKSNEEWRKLLTPSQYHILREAGTEIPFTGKLDHENRQGTYYSAGCLEPVFRSEQKYDSGTGWPSFWNPIKKDALVQREENSLPGETRIEILDKCGGHLGHVFDDGPKILPDGRQATGKRYCMNSEALIFIPD